MRSTVIASSIPSMMSRQARDKHHLVPLSVAKAG
jgi:hypothetical protein